MDPTDQDQLQKQRKLLDATYGVPSLQEQRQFGAGGGQSGGGTPSPAMEHQMHPFGTPEGDDAAFAAEQASHPRITMKRPDSEMRHVDIGDDGLVHSPKEPKDVWFVDQVDQKTGRATVVKSDGQSVEVPMKVLPKGASEGVYFDPQSGELVDDPEDGADETRQRLGGGDDMRDMKL